MKTLLKKNWPFLIWLIGLILSMVDIIPYIGTISSPRRYDWRLVVLAAYIGLIIPVFGYLWHYVREDRTRIYIVRSFWKRLYNKSFLFWITLGQGISLIINCYMDVGTMSKGSKVEWDLPIWIFIIYIVYFSIGYFARYFEWRNINQDPDNIRLIVYRKGEQHHNN